MTIQKQISLSFFTVSIALLVLVSASSAIAQGRYVARYTKRDVTNIIAKLEQSSDTFSRDFARAMDRSSLNGTAAEDRFNSNVRDYENSLDQLRRDFDRTDSWWESRSNVQNVLREAQPVNTMMTTLNFRRQLERQWTAMRRDINTLADTYDLPGLNGGGWQGGPWNPGGGIWNPGGGTSTPPSWAQGTFYWTNGDRRMTINRNGQVTVVAGGMTSYGTYNRGVISLNNDTSTVTRISGGIRTYNRTTGDTSNYSLTNSGGGNVPSWAVGTFYARNPQSGGTIQMTVARSGTVTLVFDNGAPIYATMNGTLLNNPPYQSRVSRINNGIRTTSTTNSDSIDYYRTPIGPGGGVGGGGGNVPTWAVGTFVARNPQSGGTIQMTVQRNGNVTLIFDNGPPVYATMNGTLLNNPPYQSRVSRLSNGIRTTSTTNNDFIDYFRQ